MRRLFKLLPSLLVLLIVQSAGNAQTGVITGRVITEDGSGMPGIAVTLNPVVSNQRASKERGFERTVTDEDGNFKFTNLQSRVFRIGATATKGYVEQPSPAGERLTRNLYRAGENITIAMIRGGVITGKVTTATGEPMIGVQVSPVMVRDAEGIPTQAGFSGRFRMTDDRGIYRLYGLQPGTYVVVARGTSLGMAPSPYEGETPTYHPSSTRDTAAEIAVGSGSEATGVDIRFRGDRGHAVSGTVIGGPDGSPNSSLGGVLLYSVATGNVIASASTIRTGEGPAGFAVNGVPDGEYDIVARRGGQEDGQSYGSTPRRVRVRGADVGGIELKLLPTATIAGKILVEPAPNVCEDKRKTALDEVLLSAHPDAKTSAAANSIQSFSRLVAADEKGEFAFYDLDLNRYFITPRLPNDNWYVKSIVSITPPTSATNTRVTTRPSAVADVAGAGVALKAGEKLSGVTVTIAVGAASLYGKIVAAAEGARLPARIRAHAVPAEPTAADNVLRYAEVIVGSDRTFAFKNLAPGRYFLLARAVPDDELGDRPPLPVALDPIQRTKLRKEAEAKKIEVELRPCQGMKDQILPW